MEIAPEVRLKKTQNLKKPNKAMKKEPTSFEKDDSRSEKLQLKTNNELTKERKNKNRKTLPKPKILTSSSSSSQESQPKHKKKKILTSSSSSSQENQPKHKKKKVETKDSDFEVISCSNKDIEFELEQCTRMELAVLHHKRMDLLSQLKPKHG